MDRLEALERTAKKLGGLHMVQVEQNHDRTMEQFKRKAKANFDGTKRWAEYHLDSFDRSFFIYLCGGAAGTQGALVASKSGFGRAKGSYVYSNEWHVVKCVILRC